jgi:hypothetical protein
MVTLSRRRVNTRSGRELTRVIRWRIGCSEGRRDRPRKSLAASAALAMSHGVARVPFCHSTHSPAPWFLRSTRGLAVMQLPRFARTGATTAGAA